MEQRKIVVFLLVLDNFFPVIPLILYGITLK